MLERTIFALALALALPATDTPAGDKVKLADLAEHALQQSQLAQPGGKPFHLRATLLETTNPSSEYQAKVEEFWLSPDKWKRTIESAGFSQTLIVNGDKVLEKDSGDYFPWWLNVYVTAIFDPLAPILTGIKQSNAEIPVASGGAMSQSCSDLRSRTDRWVVCFDGGRGLLQSVFMKGYGVEFREYKKFGEKYVARVIENDPEPGTHLRANVTVLAELANPDESMFAVLEPTPAVERVRTVRVDEEMVRKLSLGSTEIDWPSIGEGLTTGGCAVFISADRQGQVREAWPEGCDNAGLQDSLREQVKKWKLKPAVSNGLPVQITSLVTFTFHTTLGKALPQLSNSDVRQLVSYEVPPIFPKGAAARLKEVTINISVDETGKLTGAGPGGEIPNDVFLAAYNALTQWKFRPYIVNGKPRYFHAVLIIPVQ